jgi:hypothetical protein
MLSVVEPLDLLVVDRQNDKTVDRRDDKPVYVSLPGRYSLGDVRDSRGDPRQFACRAVNISTHEIALAAPVRGKAGLRVIADIEQLGRVKGSIVRVFRLGFAMYIAASNRERDMLAAKIDWIGRHKDFEVPDNRTHVRFIPRRPHSRLALADGSILPCFIVDISVSGASVSADIMPEIGTVLAVGSVVGRVVRFVPGGFAVRFVTAQDRQVVESLVIHR